MENIFINMNVDTAKTLTIFVLLILVVLAILTVKIGYGQKKKKQVNEYVDHTDDETLAKNTESSDESEIDKIHNFNYTGDESNGFKEDEGEILDNGDYVSKARTVKVNKPSILDIDSNETITDETIEVPSVINNDFKRSPDQSLERDDLVGEHIIGDIDFSKKSPLEDDEILNKTQQEFDLSIKKEIDDVGDILDYDTDDLGDFQSSDYKDPLTAEVKDFAPNKEVERSEYQTTVALSVIAKNNDFFEGADLLRDFTLRDFEYSKTSGFYYKTIPGLPQKTLFSVAQVMKPGNFDPKKMQEFKTKGLLLFMSLPNKMEPIQAFKQMHDAAKELADDLGGTVCDSQLNELSDYRLEQIQDDMSELSLKLEIEYKKNIL